MSDRRRVQHCRNESRPFAVGPSAVTNLVCLLRVFVCNAYVSEAPESVVHSTHKKHCLTQEEQRTRTRQVGP